MTPRTIIAVVSDLIRSGLTVEQQILVSELIFLKGLDCGRYLAGVEAREAGAERKRLSRMSRMSRTVPDKKKGPHTPKEKLLPPVSPTEKLSPTAQRNGDIHLENPFFDEFWKLYPRKVGRRAALKAFRQAVGRAGSPAKILDGVRKYAASKLDPQFTKHPTTWLNADCWLDEGNVVSFGASTGPKLTYREQLAARASQEEK